MSRKKLSKYTLKLRDGKKPSWCYGFSYGEVLMHVEPKIGGGKKFLLISRKVFKALSREAKALGKDRDRHIRERINAWRMCGSWANDAEIVVCRIRRVWRCEWELERPKAIGAKKQSAA